MTDLLTVLQSHNIQLHPVQVFLRAYSLKSTFHPTVKNTQIQYYVNIYQVCMICELSLFILK